MPHWFHPCLKNTKATLNVFVILKFMHGFRKFQVRKDKGVLFLKSLIIQDLKESLFHLFPIVSCSQGVELGIFFKMSWKY